MPLNALKIKSILNTQGFTKPYNLHLFESIDSTNNYLKELPPSATLDICCTEEQTQGRGRFNRNWYSPFGENIYCSTRWNLPCELNKLSGLSLVMSLAILATLNESTPNPDIKVKWPNDIFWKGKKLAGILIEILGESKGYTQVVIGIGLNVNSDTEKFSLEKPWCSLQGIYNQPFDRNWLISNLIIQLELYLQAFISKGLEGFMDEWDSADYLKGKKLKVNQHGECISGEAIGLTPSGQLIIRDDNGLFHPLVSGDIEITS